MVSQLDRLFIVLFFLGDKNVDQIYCVCSADDEQIINFL